MYSYDHYKITVRSKVLHLLNKRKYEQHYAVFKTVFENKAGIEIGGPSKIFTGGFLPVYQWAKRVDGCNYSNTTMWEGYIKDNAYHYFENKTGKQYILEGTDLHEISNEQYDFILSCHNLEHIANPLMALKEWIRVLKPAGFIVLILPDKRFTFDRYRPYTSFEHLLADFKSGTNEDDLTHLPEILQLHDLSLDHGAGKDYVSFKKRSEENITYRGIHHHVFSQVLLKEAFDYFSLETVDQFNVPPFHQIIIGKKLL